jgi:catechol 2,3-dioxygenase-like lactoylglutathione lyase family enzyme
VWFGVGEHQLHVGLAKGFAPATKAHPAFRVSSAGALDRLAERLEALGIAVTRPGPDEIPVTMRIFVADPWGNRIELVAAGHDVFT